MPPKDSVAPYIIVENSDIHLVVRIQTRSKMQGVKCIHAGRIKIGITSAPVNGKANEELIYYLSEVLACPRSAIQIIKGESSREKIIALKGVLVARVIDWLAKCGL